MSRARLLHMLTASALCLCLTTAPVRAGASGASEADLWGLRPLRALPLDLEVLSSESVEGVDVEELYFTSELVHGKPVRVYGFLAKPVRAGQKLPGLVELHGGGGTANKGQAVGSAKGMGACVLSLDWSGNANRAERVTVADALPLPALFGDPRFVAEDLSDFSARHTVRAISRGLDVLLAQREVDPDKLAVMGGSWGGFLAILTAGLDDRVRCVASGFGAGGFRDTHSLCARPLYTMTEERREFWLKHVDPLNHAARLNGPVALMTATNELHFWLNSAIRTFEALPRGSRLSIVPNAAHTGGAGVIWPNSAWLRHCFGNGPAWPEVREFRFDGRQATWRVVAEAPISRSTLYVSPGHDDWPGRLWLPIPARHEDGRHVAELPAWLQNAEGDAYPLVTDALRRSVSAVPVHTGGVSLAEVSRRRDDPGLIDDFAQGTDLWRLLFGNRMKARLKWQKPNGEQPGAMVVEETRGQPSGIAVETNLIVLAASRLRQEGTLRFRADTRARATRLRVELRQNTGRRGDKAFVATVALAATEGEQGVSLPLSEFVGRTGTPEWGRVDKLEFRWQAAARSALTFGRVGVF